MTANSSPNPSPTSNSERKYSADPTTHPASPNPTDTQQPQADYSHTANPPSSHAQNSTYALSGNDLSEDHWSAPNTSETKSTFLELEDAMPISSADSQQDDANKWPQDDANKWPQDDANKWPTPPPSSSAPTSSAPTSSSRYKMQQSKTPSFEYAQEDINALRTALNDNNLFRLSFYFLDYILRAQTALFEQIHRQQQLPRIIASMSILCAILSAIYGLTMGMDHSLLQSVAAAIKLPILFVLTAVICIPSLYTFNVLLGQRFKFLQTVTLMVMTLGTTSILLASLAPIAFFFSMTTPQYSFLLLLHVAIFALCGVYGVQYLYRGCAYLAFRMEQPLNNLLLRIWIVIYGLVGMQLGWRLRPFVGSDGSPFQVFRTEQGGNFYIAVWHAISTLFSGG